MAMRTDEGDTLGDKGIWYEQVGADLGSAQQVFGQESYGSENHMVIKTMRSQGTPPRARETPACPGRLVLLKAAIAGAAADQVLDSCCEAGACCRVRSARQRSCRVSLRLLALIWHARRLLGRRSATTFARP